MAQYTNFNENLRPAYKNLCFASVILAFTVGLSLGIILPIIYLKTSTNSSRLSDLGQLNETSEIRTIFLNNSYSALEGPSTENPRSEKASDSVSFVASFKDVVGNDGSEELVVDGVYWGNSVEDSLPKGYTEKRHKMWTDYLDRAVAVKLESGCGRMQNRMVIFRDGLKGCVRYRQNTDQIQGELFSFYLAQILQLPNLAPSAVSIVDLKSPLWTNIRNEIASAQWNSNRPIVLTQFVANLDAASIPSVFRPAERHLNKFDVLNMTRNSVLEQADLTKSLAELAQWSDLIIFDYLTANLDRIVNNLYNYQWNANIMDAPAHNLAKRADDDLLLFLDNESGLLHGYRLLKKYEVYHSVLLENMCVFRKRTASVIKRLKAQRNVGALLREMFDTRNGDRVKDILPTLPDKSVKVLNERIEKVYNQIVKCESMYNSDDSENFT